MTIFEENGITKTRIKVSKNNLDTNKKLIGSYIAKYGGDFQKQSSRFVYFVVNADLINKGVSSEFLR